MKQHIFFYIALIFLYIGISIRLWPIPTIISGTIQILTILYAFHIVHQIKYPIEYRDRILIYLLLFWVIFNFFRGMFVAENYWDWRLLIYTGSIFMCPIFALIFSNPLICKENYQKIFKFAIPSFIILSFLISREEDTHGRFLSIFYLLIICLNLLPQKWKIITLISVIYAFTWNIGARSTWIKPMACILIYLLICFPFFIRLFNRFLFFICCLIPVILLFLGINGTFNIFKIGEELNLQETETNRTMTADTRTALYQWVLTSAVDNHYVLFGRSPARGYDCPWIEGTETAFMQKKLGVRPNERGASEVSIHNVFTYFGIIGVILYSLVILRSAYEGLYYSSNIYIKGIALFLLFRWLYSWVEEFTDFDFTYLSLWIFVGMCYSTYFRNMNNKKFKNWLLSCLSLHKK